MMGIAKDLDIAALLLHSEAAWLHDRIEEVARTTQMRLAEVAAALQEEADCEAFGVDSGLANAARKLARLARGDVS
jgi:hypothetical protein